MLALAVGVGGTGAGGMVLAFAEAGPDLPTADLTGDLGAADGREGLEAALTEDIFALRAGLAFPAALVFTAGLAWTAGLVFKATLVLTTGLAFTTALAGAGLRAGTLALAALLAGLTLAFAFVLFFLAVAFTACLLWVLACRVNLVGLAPGQAMRPACWIGGRF